MRFPKLKVTEQTREFIQEFGGLDRRPRIPENCFFDMRNLTSDQYPALAPRPPRGVVKESMKCNGIIAKDKLAYVIGNTLYYGEGEDAVTMELRVGENVPRQLVSMGAYIVVFPDYMYFNTADLGDKGSFSDTYTSVESKEITITLCDEDKKPISLASTTWFNEKGESIKVFLGSAQYVFTVSGQFELEGVPNPNGEMTSHYEVTLENTRGTAFELLDMPSSQYAWVKFSEDTTADYPSAKLIVKDTVTGTSVVHLLHYSAAEESLGPSGFHLEQKKWGEKPVIVDDSGQEHSTCLKIQSQLLAYFNDFDNEEINIETIKGDRWSIPYLLGVPNGGVVASCKDQVLYVNGILTGTATFTTVSDKSEEENYQISLTRYDNVPKMDFVIESQNRLWGCRYGSDRDGNSVNEVYASALGDFQRWYTFDQTSQDSYTASVGDDGEFTGAINFRGMPLFFKENVMYKIYGDYPENYQIVADTGMGLQAGCDKSLCVLSNMLYYKSPQGLFVYDGSSSTQIDDVLGKEHYSNVVCGGLWNKLWVSMESEKTEYSGLYVFDGEKGMWHKEDACLVRNFVRLGNDLYMLDENERLLTARGTVGDAETDQIEFFAESGVIGHSTPDSKYVSRIALRVSIPHDGRLNLYIEYDSTDVWEFKGCIEGIGMRIFTVPIVPRSCDHFRIRFEGKGECRIFGFSKVMENGGAV